MNLKQTISKLKQLVSLDMNRVVLVNKNHVVINQERKMQEITNDYKTSIIVSGSTNPF